MKQIFKFLTVGLALVTGITACEKMEDLPVYGNGNAVSLTVSPSTVTPAIADSSNPVVSFSWTNPNYATDSANYKFILEIDSAGRNFAKKATKIILAGYSTSLTGRELNSIALDYGLALGSAYTLEARIVSSYANNNDRFTSNTVTFSYTPFNDPSVLTSSSSSVVLVSSSDVVNTFNWSKPFVGYTGNITYTLQYDSATKNFTSPQDFAVGPNVLTRGLTHSEMNGTAQNEGINPGVTGKIEYRLKAVTAGGAVSYSNVVAVTITTIDIIRLYLPGGYQTSTGNGTDWTPDNAPELMRDLRAGATNKLYYTYIFLPANSEFKVTNGRSWSINFGGSGGNLAANGANFSVTTAGVYRISIDLGNMKYDIREGRMGFVGGATLAGWNPPNVFPTYKMGFTATNLFCGVHDFGTGGWKLIDHNDWNSGDLTATNARSYGTGLPSGSALEINGGNFADIATGGRRRVIWDGIDVNAFPKYQIMDATEMRLVGDGIQGVPAWNPGASPQMTYLGNGRWSISTTLIAGKDIKFLAGNDWGAFDYEDNSGGSTATGTARKIKFNGGDNFKTPTTTGSYTIILDENDQTVTIN
ncbi:MAG: SusE domain-containing protein [Ferruginibacter sp.]